jgi:precorrin-4/cobalt-precorrin-4 C11-methyltransferase
MSANKPAQPGKVWFIGAGPGDPELMTLKGQRLIAAADLVLYAGSLVPAEITRWARPGAEVVDSSSLHLEEIHLLMRKTVAGGGLVARVQTGDPALYGALREQTALLDADGIAYGVVPGVTAAFAAAAAAALSLTVPEAAPSFAITRLSGHTPVPDRQSVRELASHGGSLAVYLSGAEVERLAGELRAAKLPEHTPVLAAYRVGWPEEKLILTTLAGLAEALQKETPSRQWVFLVLPGTGEKAEVSRLYDRNFSHAFRKSAPE